ncbi:MAG: fatty acid desaturase [Anaerolineae bacterium]|nr:fatty acid desaturase [Anaerolineae bacterium]
MSGRWYRSPVDKEKIQFLRQRSDFWGWVHVIGHISLLLLTGTFSFLLLQKQYFLIAIPVIWIHGACYSFLGWAGAGHELSHKTVFKTQFLNTLFLKFFAFLTWNNYVYFVRSHQSHHKATLSKVDDLEVPSPQNFYYHSLLWMITIDFPVFYRNLRALILNAFGIIKGRNAERLFPTDDVKSRKKLFHWARFVLTGHLILIFLFVVLDFPSLLFLVTFAPFIGTAFSKLLALGQHYGMQSDVRDFRKNTRTVLLYKPLSFLYWNMNYHVEHHTYPAIPFYQLPKLHKEISDDLEPPTSGFISLLKEIVSIKKQKTS